MGARSASPDGVAYAGASYLVFGGAANLSVLDAADGLLDGHLNLSELDGASGFRLDGVASTNHSGQSVSSAGDVDGDGFDDLIVGASYADPDGVANAGASYVIYGGNFNNAVTHLGTSAPETLTGTLAAETFVAGQGADTINGAGGADSIQAGDGGDHIHVADKTFFRVDGGGGVDTLHLDYDNVIDFGNLDGQAGTSDRGRIAGIEVIDVANGFANALTLHKADVLDIDCQIIDVAGGGGIDNMLRIDSVTGGEGDTLTLFTADGWGAADTGTLGGYAIYTSGNVRVAIDLDIIVSVS